MGSKQISLEEQKLIQVKILEYIDAFCKENNIDYSLAYGTLLGAVRHKGYIPWDDDIDIMMTRKNYDKFRSLYKSEKYPLSDLKNDLSHPVPMGKVYDSRTYFIYKGYIKRKYGLFVDIFPLDNVPEDHDTRLLWAKKIKRFIDYNSQKNNSLIYIIKNPSPIKNIVKGCLVKIFISKKYIHKKLEQLYNKYNNIETGFKSVPAVMVMTKGNLDRVFPDRLFYEYTTMEFEGYYFQIIKDYDRYLTIFYGNYMELPPVEQRVGKHGIVAYYK